MEKVVKTEQVKSRKIPRCVLYNLVKYRAAGILPISIDKDDDVCLLLAVESRPDTDNYKNFLIDIGGRIEDKDKCSSFITAVREFNEETNNILDDCITLNKAFKLKKLWCQKAKYISYLIYIEYNEELNWINFRLPNESTIKRLIWIKMRDLFKNNENYGKLTIHIRLQYLIELF